MTERIPDTYGDLIRSKRTSVFMTMNEFYLREERCEKAEQCIYCLGQQR